jgi:hypothetical protein
VPLEGHWQRVNTPLRDTTPRERLLVRGLLAALSAGVIVTVVVLIATGGGSGAGSASGAHCVQVDVPSTMGGSGIHACGSDAAAFCRGPLAHSSDLRGRALPACRAAGYE